jgi:hypothetical protein
MNWQPIETAPKDRPVFVRAVDLDGFAHALKSGKPSESMLPGITAWTTYHPSAGFTICDIRTTVQWDADASPPTVNESLTVPLDNDLDEPLGKACSLENPECESCS